MFILLSRRSLTTLLAGYRYQNCEIRTEFILSTGEFSLSIFCLHSTPFIFTVLLSSSPNTFFLFVYAGKYPLLDFLLSRHLSSQHYLHHSIGVRLTATALFCCPTAYKAKATVRASLTGSASCWNLCDGCEGPQITMWRTSWPECSIKNPFSNSR